MSVRSLMIFTPISSFFLVLGLRFSDQSHNLHPLIPCWRKILLRLPASSLSSSAWRLTLSSYSCFDSSSDPFGHYFLSSALVLEELTLIFCFFFLCLTCSSSSLSDSDDGLELAHSWSARLPFLSLFPLDLALEGRFSTILLVRFANLDIIVYPQKAPSFYLGMFVNQDVLAAFD